MTNRKRASGDTAQFARRALVVMTIAALFFVAWELRTLVVMIFGSLVVATVFRALARPIRKHTPLPDHAAVGAAIIIILGLIGTLLWVFGSEIARQVQTLTETLPAAVEALRELLSNWGMEEELNSWVATATEGGGGIIASFGRFFFTVGEGVADTLVVLFGGIFIALQPGLYRLGAIKLIPASRRGVVSEAMDNSEEVLGLWLKAQLVSMTIVGLLTGIGLWMLGVPSALVLALLAFALEFIPFAGPIIASIPAILVALSVSPTLALWTAGLYLVVQQLEGNVVYPIVQQWAVHIPAAVLLFALIAFGMLFGVLGVIFAAPLAVVVYVLVKRLYVIETLKTATPIPGVDDED